DAGGDPSSLLHEGRQEQAAPGRGLRRGERQVLRLRPRPGRPRDALHRGSVRGGPGVRPVIIEGTDGVGKTTLAKRLVARAQGVYRHAGPPTSGTWVAEYVAPLI